MNKLLALAGRAAQRSAWQRRGQPGIEAPGYTFGEAEPWRWGNRRGSWKRTRGAFTLIELLVVIAIISILASLLIPSVTAALDRARLMSGANTMRQIGLAVSQYSNEHDSTLPQCYRLQRAGMRDYPGRLASYTAPYLGLDDVQGDVNPYFGDAIWASALGVSSTDLRFYLLRVEDAPRFILNRWNRSEGKNFPWGTTVNDRTPASATYQIPTPSSLWAMQDVDAGILPGHPLVTPLWDDLRIALFFDAHVNTIPADQYFVGPLPESE